MDERCDMDEASLDVNGTKDADVDLDDVDNENNLGGKTVGCVFNQFADTTSVVGISFIKNAKNWRHRLIWICFFLFALAILMAQMVGIIQRYFAFPLSTKVEMKRGVLDFPSVTICNLNPIRFNKLDMDQDIYHFLEKVLETYDKYATQGGQMTPDEVNLTEFFNEYMALDDSFEYEYDNGHHGYSNAEFDTASLISLQFKHLLGVIDRKRRKEMGHQPHLAILGCTFASRKCYPDNFTLTMSKDYGNCFTFNSHTSGKHSLKSYSPGSNHGLSLKLFKEDLWYLSTITPGGGFRVVVHPYGTMPFPLEDGVSISPGKETFIGLNFENISRPGWPYSTCMTDEFTKEMYGTKYTRKTCLNTCADNHIAETCKCFLLENLELYSLKVISAGNLKACQTKTERKCAYRIQRELSKRPACECHRGCNVQSHKMEISENVWPDYGMWDVLVGMLCEKGDNLTQCQHYRSFNDTSGDVGIQILKQAFRLRSDFLSLHVYYKDMTYVHIIEEPAYPLTAFASDIGGTVGLWLGLSVFSGFELLNLCTQLCKLYVRRWHHRRLRKRGASRKGAYYQTNSSDSKI